jgi:outer membrane immunogenic protein
MKKLTFSMALAMIIARSAFAADIPTKTPPALKATPIVTDYNWSGAYIGFGLGGVWTEPHRFYPNLPQMGVPATTFISEGNDGIYNVHGGVQWQWGRWILGIEASYAAGFNDMKSSVSVSPPEPFTNLAATTKITDLVTVGPRIGAAFDRFMVYATGGFAAARLDGSYSCGDTGLPALPGPGACSAVFGPVIRNQNFGGITWNNGWFVGAGFEFMVYRGAIADVILGAEYQHFEVEQKLAFACTVALCGPTTHQNFLHDARGDIVRGRLTFKTAGWGLWPGGTGN